MLTITGKSLITTDWHFGLKNNAENRLRIFETVTKEVTKYMRENDVDNLIFGGDWYHSRSNIAVNTINVAMSCLEALARNCKHVYLILGNHDIFNKNSVNVNSVNMFKHIKNVEIIKTSTECMINGKRCLFYPWLGSLEYEKNTFDMAFGHFDINYKFLINSFLEENMTKTKSMEELRMLAEGDELLRESGMDDISEIIENKEETFLRREKSSDLLGDWIEVVKEKGTIFAGHIHGRKEFYAKSRKFIFIGSPYQQTRGEMRSTDGFYILNEDGSHEFHEIVGTPKFIDIRMSNVMRDIDKFDFGMVRGNIFHRIYDVEIDRVTDAKITQRFYDNKPFEEIPSEYLVAVNQDGSPMETLNTIKKSKYDYLQLYINNISDKILEERNLDRETLINYMTEYYNMAID